MAKKYINIGGQDKWNHFLNCVKAQFTATWSESKLQSRYDFSCNKRCHRCSSCKGCPVDQWFKEELAKVQAGRTREQAMMELFALGTPEAKELYDKLNYQVRHVTVVHYHNNVEIHGNGTVNL